MEYGVRFESSQPWYSMSLPPCCWNLVRSGSTALICGPFASISSANATSPSKFTVRQFQSVLLKSIDSRDRGAFVVRLFAPEAWRAAASAQLGWLILVAPG